mmetsp:Transcript_31172/g.55949  ORF Transcript_31172/g.55949 Transcript_31172/m.55949 type:complete len:284 (+) Transcript_31172:1764-2615(+)
MLLQLQELGLGLDEALLSLLQVLLLHPVEGFQPVRLTFQELLLSAENIDLLHEAVLLLQKAAPVSGCFLSEVLTAHLQSVHLLLQDCQLVRVRFILTPITGPSCHAGVQVVDFLAYAFVLLTLLLQPCLPFRGFGLPKLLLLRHLLILVPQLLQLCTQSSGVVLFPLCVPPELLLLPLHCLACCALSLQLFPGRRHILHQLLSLAPRLLESSAELCNGSVHLSHTLLTSALEGHQLLLGSVLCSTSRRRLFMGLLCMLLHLLEMPLGLLQPELRTCCTLLSSS